MHVAFLTPEYSRDEEHQGGLGNYLRKVGLELCNRGHQVTIISLSSGGAEWQDNGIQVQEVKRFRFPYRLMRLPGLRSYLPAVAQIRSAHRLEKALLQVHRKRHVDVVQASSYKSPGYTLRQNNRIPLVCRISSYTPLLRAASGLRRTLAEHLCDWLETRQVLESDASFAPSEFMANTFARLEGHRPFTIHTVPTLESFALDTSFFDQHLRDKKYLLYFGTLNRIKGIDLLAPVISPILEKHPAIEFVFIGRDHGLGNGKAAFEVLRNANQPHAKRLSYHATLAKPLLYPTIANALGVLMPSRVDNYPNACLEAQALGTPVVGTYDSSLEEMIVEGETGFLAKNCDSASFRRAVERLLALPDADRKRMRQSILATTSARAKEDRVGQHIDLYHRVIKEFSGKRSR